MLIHNLILKIFFHFAILEITKEWLSQSMNMKKLRSYSYNKRKVKWTDLSQILFLAFPQYRTTRKTFLECSDQQLETRFWYLMIMMSKQISYAQFKEFGFVSYDYILSCRPIHHNNLLCQHFLDDLAKNVLLKVLFYFFLYFILCFVVLMFCCFVGFCE